MAFCTMCGSHIPDNQGSKTCSMCYGDPGHGKDGYYQRWLDEQEQIHAQRQWERQHEQEETLGND